MWIRPVGLIFDETLLPEVSWEGNIDADEFEVDKIIDVRSGRKTNMAEYTSSTWYNGRSTATQLGLMKLI